MAVTNMVCMEDREEAFEVAVNIGMNYYTSLQMHWLDNIPKPTSFPEWPDLIPEPTVDQLKKAVRARHGRRRRSRRLRQGHPAVGRHRRRPALLQPDHQQPGPEDVIESMELFGKEVLPQFDKDPVHRTTRIARQPRPSLD